MSVEKEDLPINLMETKIDEWLRIAKRISKGTSPKLFWILGIVVVSISVFIADYFFGSHEKLAATTASPEGGVAVIQPSSGQLDITVPAPIAVNKLLRVKNDEVDRLKIEISQLKSENT